jgi:uncharacterized repeat protein (TIGR03803 family)
MALRLIVVLLPLLALGSSAQARTYKVLYNFTGGSDGGYPAFETLVQDKAGNLYGTTYAGGSSSCGTVFELAPSSGKETVLWNFTCGSDGGNPFSGLLLSGNTLYGTAVSGGSSGNGVIFSVNISKRSETVLYSFTGSSDGGYPEGGLVLLNGVLYGTTTAGGTSQYGVLYSVVIKTGVETILHSFRGNDGASPQTASLTLNKAKTLLYGSTLDGGSQDNGVIFVLTIKNSKYRVIYNFTGGNDGGKPQGTLGIDPSGNLYGTTFGGGANQSGVVFKVVPKARTETVLHSFIGGSDGAMPDSGILWTKQGLYGTTFEGGDPNCNDGYGCGSVYKVTTTGKETVLHRFNGSDGLFSFCGVLADAKGNLFGTTQKGGSSNNGVVWRISQK